MADNSDQKKGGVGVFTLWFMQSVLVPLAPLFIAAFVDVLIGVPAHWASSETVLVYTFVLPVVYLESSRGPLGTTFFWITSVAGVILYTVAHLMDHLAPTHNKGLIYSLAVGLDIIYI